MIDRTSTDTHAAVVEVNYDAINAILDAAETALLGLAVEHRLHGIRVDRWRWDQPEIVMSWSPVRGMLGLDKNICVFVLASDSVDLKCSVESNAWLDEHHPAESFVRFWDNFPGEVRTISDPANLTEADSQWLRDQIGRAYDRIADRSRFVLNRSVRLFPDGRSQPLEGSLHISSEVAATRKQARNELAVASARSSSSSS